ncbi:aldehyde dehydrogenase family protein [Cupriavidus basilensis]
MPQPLGVIGIVGAVELSALPDGGPAGRRPVGRGQPRHGQALRVHPRFAALFARLAQQHFAADEVAVINGDAEVASAFSAQPFDHLLFTGSTQVGHHVMRAAAANLTLGDARAGRQVAGHRRPGRRPGARGRAHPW